MRLLLAAILFPVFVQAHMSDSSYQLVALSQQLLQAVKTEQPTAALVQQLSTCSLPQLQKELATHDAGLAFWINIYNAYTQLLLQQDPEAYQHRSRFFSRRQISIAGNQLSLDLIEHGIIRREWKWGLGYVKRWFPGKLERQLRLPRKDYRIHFALNCGARSCPPILFYTSQQLQQQLEQAEAAFVKADAEKDSSGTIVTISKIYSWFPGDFGGKKGIKALLAKHGVIAPGQRVRLRYRPYNWQLALKAF